MFISLASFCADAISPLINLFGLNVYPFMPGKKQTNARAVTKTAAEKLSARLLVCMDVILTEIMKINGQEHGVKGHFES